MAEERKAFLLRLDPALWKDVERWAGDELRSVNGRELKDFLDWEFLSADDTLELEAKLPDGELVVFEVDLHTASSSSAARAITWLDNSEAPVVLMRSM